jgi:hypothetical protein
MLRRFETGLSIYLIIEDCLISLRQISEYKAWEERCESSGGRSTVMI